MDARGARRFVVIDRNIAASVDPRRVSEAPGTGLYSKKRKLRILAILLPGEICQYFLEINLS
jgi:hypothetical protein